MLSPPLFRCLEDIAGLLSLVAVGAEAYGFDAPPELPLTELDQKGDSLVRNLTGGRAYVSSGAYDPRFLIFEFQSGVLLRSRQVCTTRGRAGHRFSCTHTPTLSLLIHTT